MIILHRSHALNVVDEATACCRAAATVAYAKGDLVYHAAGTGEYDELACEPGFPLDSPLGRLVCLQLMCPCLSPCSTEAHYLCALVML